MRSRRGGVEEESRSAGSAAAAGMANVWGDWMNEEMTPAAPSAAKSDSKEESKPSAAATTTTTGPRSYLLPLTPPSSSSGILAQTGTLDSTIPGRSSMSKENKTFELQEPTVLFPDVFRGEKCVGVFTGCSACHSVVNTEGEFVVLYSAGWLVVKDVRVALFRLRIAFQ